MKVLIIGGTRFVGLRFLRALVQQGHDISILNRGKTEAKLPAGIKRLYADRRNPDDVKTALKGLSFDAVYDFTGYQVRNLQPMVELLKGRVQHYLFQSTCGVYADSELTPILESFPLRNPQTSKSGLAAYEIEKVQCEMFLSQAFKEQGFPATVFRCPVIYGPENWMHEREFSYFVRLQQNRPVLIPGNGATFMSFTHADDLARAHTMAMGNKRTFGQTYTICGSEAITINGYIDAIARLVGAEPKKVYLDFSQMKGIKQQIFPFRWEKSSCYSNQKAKEHFGWTPQLDIISGLKNTYEWWSQELGVARTVFQPGKLGYDVDLAFEEQLAKQLGG